MEELLQSFHFLRPAFLWLGPASVAIWWAWRKHADPLGGWRSQVDPELLDALSDQSDSKPRSHLPLLLAWLIATFAMAGPSWKPEPSPFAEDSAPLIILLKADTSMDTPDPEPSRIERAHLKIIDIAQARKGQPLGLIAYSGSAHLVLPPTKDTFAVATMAKEISPEIMPVQGDRIDLAIHRAEKLLAENGGSLLIITDTASSATSEIKKAYASTGSPSTQILAISSNEPSTSSLEPLAKSLNARLVSMSDDDSDIETIVKGAARAPVSKAQDGSTRWQDAGYYFTPLLAIFSLLPFRREASAKPTP